MEYRVATAIGGSRLSASVSPANSSKTISGTTIMRASRGFSILEMAVVLVILSILLSGVLMSLGQVQESKYRSTAEQDLANLVEALYGFAQANGRLPCPATAASGGLEAPVGGSTTVTPCTQRFGFIPSATLGLAGSVNTQSLLLDPWQSPYRYAVTNANLNAFTSPNGMRNATISALAPNFRICAQAACTTVTASSVPAVVMSLGQNWTAFTGADEAENSGETTTAGYRHGNDNDFVSTGYVEDVFDDIITWISPNILYTRLISAGQLP